MSPGRRGLKRAVRFSPDARIDLEAALAWTRRDSPAAARSLRGAVFAGVQLLGEHPFAGPERPELTWAPVRFLALLGHPYPLAYRLDEAGRPVIVRLLHTARDIHSLLRRHL